MDMANKKDIKDAAKASADVLDMITTGRAQNTESAQGAKYRINLSLIPEAREYLARRAYEESSPQHIVSITEYLNELIRKDMAEHGEK